jgi:hypothetical protein
MKRVIGFLTIVSIAMVSVGVRVWARKTHEGLTRLDHQTETFVRRAATLVAQRGRVAAACAFNDKKGRFQRGFQYIFAVTCGNPTDEGFIVADPATPEYNYTNRKKQSLIIKTIVEDSHQVLQQAGKWYEYCWVNPVTHESRLKRSYVMMIPKENLCVGSGYYFRKPCTFKG